MNQPPFASGNCNFNSKRVLARARSTDLGRYFLDFVTGVTCFVSFGFFSLKALRRSQ